jgi:hypothetical protein
MLFDDAFSALDEHTRTHIFEELCVRELRYTIRIISTHTYSIAIRPEVDCLYVLDSRGHISSNASLLELQEELYTEPLPRKNFETGNTATVPPSIPLIDPKHSIDGTLELTLCASRSVQVLNMSRLAGEFEVKCSEPQPTEDAAYAMHKSWSKIDSTNTNNSAAEADGQLECRKYIQAERKVVGGIDPRSVVLQYHLPRYVGTLIAHIRLVISFLSKFGSCVLLVMLGCTFVGEQVRKHWLFVGFGRTATTYG